MRGAIDYDIHELDRAFKLGFFSDNVVRTLALYKERGRILNNEDRSTQQLAKAYEFLELVEKGKEQVNTGMLQSNAIDSIGAYRRSLSVFICDRPDVDFQIYIDNIKNGINRILKSEDVEALQIETIERFFKTISEATLEETEKLLEKNEDLPTWMPGLKMP